MIHPEDKKKTLLLLDRDLSFELSHPPQTRRPIVTAYSGMKKYDLFFLPLFDLEPCTTVARKIRKLS
jgi:hypothetical protein